MNFANRWRLVFAVPALLAFAACAVTAGKVSQKKPVAPIDSPAAVALDGYGATRNAAFVREAAAVYAERGLLRG